MQKVFVTKTDDLDRYNDFIRGDLKGVIPLAVPVMNVVEWPGICSHALNLSEETIADIIYYRSFVVTVSGGTNLKEGTIISKKDRDELKSQKVPFTAVAGAEGVEYLLGGISMNEEIAKARSEETACMQLLETYEDFDELPEREDDDEEIPLLDEDGNPVEDFVMTKREYREQEALRQMDEIYARLDRIRKRLTALMYVRSKKGHLSFTNVVLFPVQVRSLLQDASRKYLYDLNDLERLVFRVVSKNERLAKLMKLQAPAVILENEARMLQEAVDCLYANGVQGKPYCIGGEEDSIPAMSLRDILVRQLLVSGK